MVANGRNLLFERPWAERSAWLALVLLVVATFPCAKTCAQIEQAPPMRADPASFAFVIDTSGSMVGYYARRDPKPDFVTELVQSLVYQTVVEGDRVVFLTFAAQVYDKPGEMVAISDTSPSAALKEMGRLRLRPQPGFGTVRTAALGRAVKALQDLAPGPGVLFVITDRDDDVVPSDEAKEYYDYARRLQSERKLQRVATIPQGGIVLELWHLKGDTGSMGVSALQKTLDTVKELLQRIIPGRPLTPGPVALDFEQGGLAVSFPSRDWKLRKVSSGVVLETPVELQSRYRALHFRGAVVPTGVVSVGGKPAPRAKVELILDEAPLLLVPDERVAGTLRISHVRPPSFFTFRRLEVGLKPGFKATGAATTEANLFAVADPVAEAKVTGAIWLTKAEPAVTLSTVMPRVPALPPPIGWQLTAVAGFILGIIFALARKPYLSGACFGAAAGSMLLALWWLVIGAVVGVVIVWIHDRAVRSMPKELVVYYWVEGREVPDLLTLKKPGDSGALERLAAVISRPSKEDQLVVKAEGEAKLLDSGGAERSEITLRGQGSFIIVAPSGAAMRVNVSTTGTPPRPESSKAYTEQQGDNSSTETSARDQDDWPIN